MITKYQLIILGIESPFIEEILKTFYIHIEELGINRDSIIEINEKNFNFNYIANAPTFCLYFGSNDSNYTNLDFVDILIKDATLILPIVSDLKQFNKEIPEFLRNNNGIELKLENDIEKIVSVILEGFGLLRSTRKLFISYKRDESTSVAIQLFEQFEKSGFDVFLDTHSIRPGEKFQEELWHRMTDCDVIVILNTPEFMGSKWCKEELAEANTKSIGIFQLIWPNHNLEDIAKLCIPHSLTEADFIDGVYNEPTKSLLTQKSVNNITYAIESLRARSLASRQDKIISEFISVSKKLKLDVTLQPEKIITQYLSNGKERVFIPTVGIPQSFTYNQSEELIRSIRKNEIDSIFLLYDHRSIRDRWLKHLSWLDSYLKVKSTKIVGIEKWLENN